MMTQTHVLCAKLAATLLALGCRPAYAQNIELIPPGDLSPCSQATWQVSVSNTSSTPLTQLELTLLFTTPTGAACGISYVAGSITGAAEADLSNPAMPVFALPDLAVGESVQLTLEAAAGCALYDCINSGELLVTQATLTYDGGVTTATTPLFNAFTPLLVITQITPTVASASATDTIVRTIAIRNTREGSLSEFVFTDHHPSVAANTASISADVGEVLVQNDELLVLRLDADDFAQIGDGDAYFDKDELIVITEKISLNDCDIRSPAFFVSQISVKWGCAGTYCQDNEATALVRFDPAVEPQPFHLEWAADSLVCACTPTTVRAYLTNTADSEAENLFAIVTAEGYPAYGIDSASIVARIDGDTVAWNATWTAPPTNPSDACLAELDGGKARGILSFPNQVLPVGSTLELTWTTRSCTAPCDQPEVDWRLEWQYDARCFKNVKGQAAFTQPSSAPRPFATSLVSTDSAVAPPDTSFAIHLSFPTEQPAADTGSTLLILLTIQEPLRWADTNSWTLSGVPPDSLAWLTPDSTQLLLSYPWPLPTDTAHLYWSLKLTCNGPSSAHVPLSSCDLLYCPPPTNAAGLLYAKVTSKVYLPLDDCPLSCRPKSCDSLLFHDYCFAGTHYDTVRIGTFVDYSFTTFRTNLGLRDDNDDRIADNAEPANPLLVARHRALPGDTLLSRMEGLVVVDSAGLQPNAIRVAVRVRYPGMDDVSEIQPLHNTLTIFDASTGALYSLEDLPLESYMTNAGWLVEGQFSAAELALLGYDIPPQFLFEQEDEIAFQIEWKIGNIGAPNSEQIVQFFPTLKISESKGWQGVNCGDCLQAQIRVAVPEFSLVPGIFPLPPCDTSDYVGGTLVKVELPSSNFFPYEVRPLADFRALQMTLPDGVQLVEGKVTLYQLQSGPLLATQIPLPIAPSEADQYFDMDALLPALIPDEGWLALMQYRFTADCSLNMPLTLAQTAHVEWAMPLPQAGPASLDHASPSLRPLQPNLILASTPLNTLQTAELQQRCMLINQSNVVGSVSSGVAPNAFFYADDEIFSDCRVWRMPDSIPIPETNGIFQIGDIAPGDTVEILLQCGYDVCDNAAALLSYGWSCTPLQSRIQTPCTRKESFLLLEPVPGEIEMSVPQTPTPLSLCEENGPFELTFYNAERGRLYEPVLRLFLPQGLAFAPGSAEMQWPCPGGTWTPLPDPAEIAPGLWEWSADMWPEPFLSEGLGGITEAPLNAACIRFNGTTSCDLASPDYFIASLTATQGCGMAANRIARISDTLQVQGTGTASQATIHADYTFLSDACGDTLELSVSITPDTDIAAGATLVLALPEGLTWLTGSCMPISVITDCTPSVEGHLLKWLLPAIAQGEVAAMRFQLAGFRLLDCSPQYLRWQLRAGGDTLFCTAINDSCQIPLGMGSLIQPLQPMRPEYRIADFSGTIVPAGTYDHLAWNATVYNDGATIAGTFTGSLYLDNGNGTLDAGDQLLQQVSAPIPPAGATVTLSGNALLPADQWCHLLLVVPAEDTCHCLADTATPSSPVEVLLPDTLFACPDTAVPLGLAETNALGWQWQPNTGIACPSCPNTTLTLPNELTEPIVYEYTLHAQLTQTCFAEYRFAVVVRAGGGLLSPVSDLCEGQPLVLIASEGTSYQWSGPGVSDTSRILVHAQPQSGTYYLTVTDTSGCTFIDSTRVNVWPAPTADAGGDYSFCPADEAILQAGSDPSYIYEWSPSLPWLDNPLSPSPQILVRSDQTYVLKVTDSHGCTDTDTAQVTFGQSPDLLPPAEVVLCDSGTVTLAAEGASWYEWAPAGDCLDPACSTVQYALSENQTVVLTGYNSDGCATTALVEMRIADDTILTTADTVLLCAGDTLELFPGQPPVTQAGQYCHTFQAVGGCDSIACVPVALAPPADTGWVHTPPQCPGTTVVFFGTPLEEEGIHCVQHTSAAGCDSLVCTELTWLPSPVLQVSPQTATIAPGEEILLQATTDADTLWWSPAAGLSCTTCPTPVASPTSSTTYTVSVLDDNGCTNSTQVAIDVRSTCAADSIQLPNLFTPNGDGLNDTFGPVRAHNQVDATFWLEIRNRWGQRIFVQQGPQVSWDGTWMGQLLPADVYFFVLEVRCPDHQTTLRGEVTLMR